MVVKGMICNGNARVNGILNTATHIDNIDSANIIKVEFAQLLNPTVLNEEVTLVTIPAGYVGRLSHMNSITNVGVSYFQNGDITSSATVALYFTSQQTGIEDYYDYNIGGYYTATMSASPWISENSTIRAKVTVAGVGYTSKLLLEGIIYLQKI